jgi:hypothetical protein
MPFVDPEKKKAYMKQYQPVWLAQKNSERKALGLCTVNGCGLPHSEESVKFCSKHREMNNSALKLRRANKKEQQQ